MPAAPDAFVCVIEARIHLEDSQSLKSKRQIVRSLASGADNSDLLVVDALARRRAARYRGAPMNTHSLHRVLVARLGAGPRGCSEVNPLCLCLTPRGFSGGGLSPSIGSGT